MMYFCASNHVKKSTFRFSTSTCEKKRKKIWEKLENKKKSLPLHSEF